MCDRNPRRIGEFLEEINDMERSIQGLAHSIAEVYKDRAHLAYEAEWHIQAIIYHLRRLFDHYDVFAQEVIKRARSGANILIMYAPSYRELLFEFYALVNICRISLDNLRIYLRPLFIDKSNQLPKSIRDILKGSTNCPVYQMMCDQQLLYYLLDIRNCLVHYRSFAVSDNAYVIEEGYESIDTDDLANSSFFTAMARAYFRAVGENSISVNIYVPDKIFEINEKGNKALANFTYDERWSLLSTAHSFACLVVGMLMYSMKALQNVKEPIYEFSPKGQ